MLVMVDTHGLAVGSFTPSLPSRAVRLARYADKENVGCMYPPKVNVLLESNHIYRDRGYRYWGPWVRRVRK